MLGLFIGAVVHDTSIRDWKSIRLVLYAGAGLVVGVVILPLAAWVIVKAVRRRRASPPRLRQDL